jgi:cytoskeletal protein CcmA (bactofilin family)
MARERDNGAPAPESVISIIGPGMTIVGDCETDGTIRIEGSVEGSIKAGKAVVIGKQGVVTGDITTQDAVISGRVEGTLVAASRLELQATCRIEGEIHTRRMQLEEGAVLNGNVHMGQDLPQPPGKSAAAAVRPDREPATAASTS